MLNVKMKGPFWVFFQINEFAKTDCTGGVGRNFI